MSNQNLTGKWSCTDSGTYYIRQLGEEILWYGERDLIDPQWSNVAHGTINNDLIVLRWMDVPKGIDRRYGVIVIEVSDDGNTLKTINAKADSSEEYIPFDGYTWTKIS